MKIRSHPLRHRAALWLALALLVACGETAPRYANVRLTHDAPDAMLTGVAGGPRAAADLIVGCVGFLDEGAPDHVLTVVEPMKLHVVARSPRGPISLAIVGPDGAVCDDDAGTGHAPNLGLIAPGRYEIWVAARASADARLPYELAITKDDKSRVRLGTPASGGNEVANAGTPSNQEVSVSVTSEPSGAEVRTPGGQVLGTTPAMFVVPVSASELNAPLTFVVATRTGSITRVEGRPQRGELVLHATLAASVAQALPGETIQSAVAQRIRDFTTVTQGAEYAGDCTITDLSVTVDVRHTCPSDLRVTLRSPSGDTATLQNHGSRRLTQRTFAMSDARALSRFVGQPARGRWELTVRDDIDADVGSFESFSVRFTCGGRTASATPGSGNSVSGTAVSGNSVSGSASSGTAASGTSSAVAAFGAAALHNGNAWNRPTTLPPTTLPPTTLSPTTRSYPPPPPPFAPVAPRGARDGVLNPWN